MFTNNEANLWKNSIEYMHDALYYYSLWNGDYPYKHCTAVDGTISAGSGMEYPNVTVIGESGSAYLLEEVIIVFKCFIRIYEDYVISILEENSLLQIKFIT